MLTEFEARRRIESIRTSRMAPLRKVRMLLRIGKALFAQERSIRRVKEQIALTPDRKAEAGLTRMETTVHQMHEEVREAAFEALHPPQQNPYLS